MKAPRPTNEKKRLQALQRYRVLDTAAEESYDDITTLAAYVCATPVAFVSLVDAERQWFKSKVGIDVAETRRDVAFCAHTILGKEMLVVSDARTDARFIDSPLIRAPHGVRFYAGMPLVTPDGCSIGALCVVDRKPRTLNSHQTLALRALARQIVHLLEQRRVSAALAEVLVELHTISGLLPICAYCKRVRDDAGYWSDLEQYVRTRTQADFTHGICPTCASAIFPGIAEPGAISQKHAERFLPGPSGEVPETKPGDDVAQG